MLQFFLLPDNVTKQKKITIIFYYTLKIKYKTFKIFKFTIFKLINFASSVK